jgi:hypothetical protein
MSIPSTRWSADSGLTGPLPFSHPRLVEITFGALDLSFHRDVTSAAVALNKT